MKHISNLIEKVYLLLTQTFNLLYYIGRYYLLKIGVFVLIYLLRSILSFTRTYR
jgi:hypothetical protein